MNKEIIQIQIAWFFSNIFKGNFEDFSLKLKNKLGASNATSQLPLPSDAPSEIPRLILNYQSFNLNIAKNRLDLFLKDIESTPTKSAISNINDVILKELFLPVGRIGFVKNFFIDADIRDLKKLLQKENVEKLDLKEISIRINEIKKVANYGCNNIESLSTGFIIKKEADGRETKKAGIIIARDINTSAEILNEGGFTKEIIDGLIEAFNEESNNFIIYPDL